MKEERRGQSSEKGCQVQAHYLRRQPARGRCNSRSSRRPEVQVAVEHGTGRGFSPPPSLQYWRQQVKFSTYPLANGNIIVLVPDIPKWLIVDKLGLEIFTAMASSTPLAELKLKYPAKLRRDVGETYIALSEMIEEAHSYAGGPVIERSLTETASVAMVNVTDLCNMNCIHCYIDANTRRQDEMTVEEHRILAPRIVEALCPRKDVKYRVALTGGEPFFLTEIIEIIEAYTDAGLGVSISTNGLLIENHQIERLCELEVSLSISMDGASSQCHEFIRGEGTFKETIKIIDRLVSSGVRVGINTLVHEGNFHELEAIVQTAHDLGCNGVNPINLVQLGRACDSGLVRVPETEIFRRLAAHLAQHPDQAKMFEKSSMFSSIGAALLAGITCFSCGIGNRPCVYIGADGSVYPCANTQRSEFLLGNVRTTPLKECADPAHPILASLRKLRVDTMNPKCGACDVRRFCGGDCRGETHNVTGDIRAPYIACDDRHDSIIALMEIVAEHPWMFEHRADEYIVNASRGI